MDSVTEPYDKCIDLLVKSIELDPGFKEYFQWSLENKIPTVVVSSGMEPIIRAILKNLIGPEHEKLDIVSNDVEARPGKKINEEGGWQIKYHDDRLVEATAIVISTLQLTAPAAVLDTTSLSRSGRTRISQQTSDQHFSTQETASQTSQLPARQIFFSPSTAMTSLATVRKRMFLSQSSTIGVISSRSQSRLWLARRLSRKLLMKASRITRRAQLVSRLTVLQIRVSSTGLRVESLQ